MLCSYFISKLYLKITGFFFFICPLFIDTVISFFFSSIDLEFLFTVLPLATVYCSLPCCKRVSYWSVLVPSSFCVGKKEKKTKKITKKKKKFNTNSSVSVSLE